jgi:hypothetical protein
MLIEFRTPSSSLAETAQLQNLGWQAIYFHGLQR